MAIKPCRECEEMVSSKAKVCPRCGIKKPVRSHGGTATFIIFILLIAVCYSVGESAKESGSNVKSLSQRQADDSQPSGLVNQGAQDLASNPAQWAFNHTKMEKSLGTIEKQPDWVKIDMAPPSVFELIYSDRPSTERVQADTELVVSTVLNEIKSEGLNPAADGNFILVPVVACQTTCGKTKDDWLKYGLGTSTYNPTTDKIVFTTPDSENSQ